MVNHLNPLFKIIAARSHEYPVKHAVDHALCALHLFRNKETKPSSALKTQSLTGLTPDEWLRLMFETMTFLQKPEDRGQVLKLMEIYLDVVLRGELQDGNIPIKIYKPLMVNWNTYRCLPERDIRLGWFFIALWKLLFRRGACPQIVAMAAIRSGVISFLTLPQNPVANTTVGKQYTSS